MRRPSPTGRCPGVRQNDIGGPGRRAPRRNPCDHAVSLLRVWAWRGQCHSGGHLPARSRLACGPSLLRRNAGPPSTVEHPAMARASATAPAAEARSAWRPAGCGRRRFGRVIMVGSHPVGPGRLPWRAAQLNHLPRASTRTPMARTRRASAFNSSLTFRAVVLPPRTLACLPLGLEKAPPVCRADCPSSPVASTERCPVAAGRISAARSHWGGAAASPARHG